MASAGSSGSGGPDLRRSSPSSSSSSRLEDFRRLHGLSVSDAAFSLIGASWRQSSSSRYDAVWACFKDFLHARGVPLSSVDLDVVADYLASLFSAGKAYRTMTLHRSDLSSMFPPVGGFSLGTHPVLSRLIRGVFQQRPPSRRLFPSWDVASVFAVFSSMTPPLDFISLQRRCAFLLAMATSRRPSELAALRCDAAFMMWRLSRTFFVLVMPWVFATPTSSRRRRRLMVPSPSPPSLDSFDGCFSALGFRRRRVPRAPFLSPTPLPVAFPSKRRFAPAIGPVQAPSIVTTFVHLARL